jgi:hypothetical protein
VHLLISIEYSRCTSQPARRPITRPCHCHGRATVPKRTRASFAFSTFHSLLSSPRRKDTPLVCSQPHHVVFPFRGTTLRARLSSIGQHTPGPYTAALRSPLDSSSPTDDTCQPPRRRCSPNPYRIQDSHYTLAPPQCRRGLISIPGSCSCGRASTTRRFQATARRPRRFSALPYPNHGSIVILCGRIACSARACPSPAS